ncbi:MAG: hypothetical protein ABIQ11_00525 [Saprospiraceae bacterium]
MLNKHIRDIVNLLLYGGAFIGLCAACITALTFELAGRVDDNLSYILLIGSATAALYSAHRVIGLQKVSHVRSHERYSVIRQYKQHIWAYFFVWLGLTIWFLIPLWNVTFVLWLIPGGVIAVTYVMPFLSGGRRLRDLGWVKILLIGWSWAWLTAFLPAYYFSEISMHLSVIIGIERLLFIVAITIPFEIRDLKIDQSVGLVTMPARFGLKRSIWWGRIMCALVVILSMLLSFHFFDPDYVISMFLICVMTIWVLQKSSVITDDYFFSGVTDGLMILALVVYWILEML